MRKLTLWGALCLSLMAGQGARGESLFQPFILDSAETLPKGVRNVSVTGFSMDVSDKFNGYGTVQPIGGAFNKSVTWNDLVKAQPAGFERDSLKGYLQSRGYDLNQVVGQANGVVDTRVTTTIPVAAYGITDNFTVAAVVPVLYSNINVSTGWTANQNMNAAIAAFDADGKAYKILQNKNKLNNVVVADLNSKGYDPMTNESRTDIGDVTLVAKYRFYKDDNWAMAVIPRVVLPTGRVADINKVVDVGSGSGVWDLGLAEATDYTISGKWTLSGSLGYIAQLPTYMAQRIPIEADSAATPDVDSSTYVKYGDIYSGQIGPKFKAARWLTLGGALAYQYKAPDQYSGGQYDGDRYGWLSTDTEQTMFSGQVAAVLSTVPMYLAHTFAIPFEASIGYSNVLSGRNVNITELYTASLSMFF